MPDLKSWSVDTGIRAVKTAAQTLVALFGAGQFNALHVDWKTDLAIAAGAGVVSILQNISSIPTPTKAAVVVVAPATEPAAGTIVIQGYHLAEGEDQLIADDIRAMPQVLQELMGVTNANFQFPTSTYDMNNKLHFSLLYCTVPYRTASDRILIMHFFSLL